MYLFVYFRRRQLPSIEEAWNLPISAEMSSRHPKSAPPPYPGKRSGPAPDEPLPLTPQQLQTLQYLQRNSHNLSPQQQVGIDRSIVEGKLYKLVHRSRFVCFQALMQQLLAQYRLAQAARARAVCISLIPPIPAAGLFRDVLISNYDYTGL